MEHSYEQLNIEFVETRKVSLFTKMVSTGLSLTLVAIPLVEILPDFKYIYNIYDYCMYGCLIPMGINCFPFL
ncbi:hypothetical protein [Tenacibaculum sp. MAR_2009_124]|uniref:hypothetical protein n=1 Tax=Tenacibaculum sp. MAR_2009_124 TaxID=1250059 RepID=UPI000B89A379|nr:hypothetical protein [Tenacibaculum sp. MAR_2009_124]